MLTIKELVKILPEELQPSIAFDNVIIDVDNHKKASWNPYDEKISRVCIEWDDVEYKLELEFASGKAATQVGTINMLERGYKKRKELETNDV